MNRFHINEALMKPVRGECFPFATLDTPRYTRHSGRTENVSNHSSGVNPRLLKSIGILMLLLLSACVANVKVTGQERPAWIDNPGNGVSASAGMHVRGEVAQEELAILRAREEYAKRFGVNIKSAQILSTTVTNGRSSTVGTEIAHEDSHQMDVKAVVKAKWRDPESDVLWVWLVPSDQ